MRAHETEILDLALTQAIERYIEMEPDKIYEAIINEWPEQIAVLLVEFFFKTTCPRCGGPNDFVEIERDNGHGNYITAICACEIAHLDGGGI